jgi:GGDEF domain-containing protein
MANTTHHIRVEADPVQYERMFDRETGLPRWPLLLDRTTIALARAHRVNRVVAVFVFDDPRTFDGELPDFRDLGQRLHSRVRPDDTVARVARRSFVVVCNDIRRDQDAATVAQRLLQSSGVIARLGVALGVPGDSAESLLTRALDQAAMPLQ